MNTKKRANKKQRELLLERLHANIELVRGNQADQQAIEFWAHLASELNVLGCSRTVKEWQHIWSVWVSKTKTKARKIRRSLSATGGGPGIDADLDDTEGKILEVVGSASVFGHDSIELGILPVPSVSTGQTVPGLDVPCTSSARTVCPVDVPSTSSTWYEELEILTETPREPPPSSPPPPTNQPAPSQTSHNSDLPRLAEGQPRSRRSRSRRPRTNEALIQALNVNGQAWRDAVLQAAHVIAAAIRSLHPQPPSPNPQP